ncbi:MAG TPA: arginase family protein [Baekduia sp.]|nr:arginase family protein [Baekduia sp.]
MSDGPPLAVIAWPFEHGSPDIGMGAGAALLAGDAALHAALSDAGWAPTVQRILSADPGAGEITRIFELLRAQEVAVREAVGRGAFPLVLAGGCISATGTVAGCGAEGAVWLDAHADLDTPQDNVSGSMDVMALSLLCGGCWPAQHATIPNAVALREDHIALLGVRDLAPYQRDRLHGSALHTAPGAFDAATAIAALPRRLYLHVDLDVLDTSVGHANRYAAPGGPSLDTVLATIDATFEHATVLAAALTAYEPPSDHDDKILAAARTIAERIALRAFAQRT